MRWKLGMLIVLLAALVAGAYGWIDYYAKRPLSSVAATVKLEITPGSNLKQVARKLTEAGLLKEPWSFIALARAQKKAEQIKAGEYSLSGAMTPLELLDKLTRGETALISITFIEGQTFDQMRAVLDAHPDITHDTRDLSEAEILRLVGVQESDGEGMFFPDTYVFGKGVSDIEVLKRAYRTMQDHLAKAWEERAPSLPYDTPYAALVMASVVEKETGKAQERPEIAAVFVNRLRLRMRLQSDPTVIYGMGERYNGNITKKDLQTDTPYNTYTRGGLPPTPIAMPGLAAIKASLDPAPSQALYFVARGDGSHEFSANLTDHNRAVARYQKIAQ